MQQWEYKIIDNMCFSGYSGERELNELGAEGWELVAIRTNPFNNLSEYAVFKRPKVC